MNRMAAEFLPRFHLPDISFVVQSTCMNEQERAEEHLKTIRRLMERATIYRAISAPTALVGGVLSLVASGIWLASTPYEAKYPPFFFFLFLWLLVLLLTAGTNTLFIILGAKKRNEPMFSASMKAALVALAPAFMVGGIFTFCIAGTRPDPDLEFQTSIVWAILYGLGLLATGHFSPRSLILLGWAFLGSGIAAALYLTFGRGLFLRIWEVRAGTFFMALTFGLFHLIYAACAWPRKGAAPEL
jgi:hypothetical protein